MQFARQTTSARQRIVMGLYGQPPLTEVLRLLFF